MGAFRPSKNARNAWLIFPRFSFYRPLDHMSVAPIYMMKRKKKRPARDRQTTRKAPDGPGPPLRGAGCGATAVTALDTLSSKPRLGNGN